LKKSLLAFQKAKKHTVGPLMNRIRTIENGQKLWVPWCRAYTCPAGLFEKSNKLSEKI
jgi:hypothetical protein